MVAVTVNFHPYKRTKNGNSILQAFRQDPYLRSQYETRTSNGGLTAYQGGNGRAASLIRNMARFGNQN